MNIYQVAAAVVAGICFAYGLLYLFIGLRRGSDKALSLTFSLFALGYAGTVFNGIRFHAADSLDAYVAIVRFDTIFVLAAWVGLIWFVGTYTNAGSRPFLGLLTALFIITGIVNMARPTMLYGQILELAYIELPWGERLAFLDATESFWSILFLLAQLVTLVYLVTACLLQYRRGQRRDATILGAGVLWFVGGIFLEVLAEAGVIRLFYWGEFGFLGLAVAVSLQMANQVIETEEGLDRHRQNLEELVDERTAELQAATARMVQQERAAAADEERDRIARDLHDAVTQTIYSASLIAEVLPKVWERSPEEGRRNLVKLRQLVRGALAEMRSMLFELRPSALEAADLITLLQQQADVLTGQTRIPVDLALGEHAEPPTRVKVGLYRITQEAFNNIVKHARATQVAVTLHGSQDRIRLAIEDNGRGFDAASVSADRLGLRIMQERAWGIGAGLAVSSAPGQGTRVTVAWPAVEERSSNA